MLAFTGPTWSGAITLPRLGGVGQGEAEVISDLSGQLGAPPAIFHVDERTAVAFAGTRGVEVRRLGATKSVLVCPNTATFDVAMGRRGSRVFAADGRGVVTASYDADGLGQDERWLEHGGRAPRIAAARAADAEIAVVSWESERALFVVSGSEGKPRVVRHELPSECVGLAAAGAGNRAGIAVALAGTDAIEVGVIDVRGVVVERLHTCLMGRGARWRHPRVLWIEDAFHVLAVDITEGRTVLARFDDGRVICDVAGSSAPFTAAYYEKSLYVARATLDESNDAILVKGHRIGLSGETATFPFEVPIPAPPALWNARATVRCERLVRATCAELDAALDPTRHGYRGGAERPSSATVDAQDSLRARIEPLHATLGATAMTVRPCAVDHTGQGNAPQGYDLTLVALAVGATGEPEPEDSFERLARWVRERLSKRAFAAALAERAWVDAVAARIGGEAFWDHDENGLRLVLHIQRLPEPARLTAWLQEVLAQVAGRSWESAPAAPTGAE